ncbi:MAG: hypothetical protein HQL78_11365 [Magnetococcales bacterium]|nr:hypothetical protein [Magnetococcales bacterium]
MGVSYRRALKPYAILLLLFFPGDGAADGNAGRWHVMGYGTLGLNADDGHPKASFIRDITQREQDSSTTSSLITDDAWKRDTRLGLQVVFQVTPTVSVVSQGVLRDQVSSKLTHYIDWTFLAFNPVPEVDARIGRVGYDVFLMSEQRNLGYSYPWVRPPVEFYGWVPLYSVDGGDLAYNLTNQGSRWRFKIQGGSSPGLGVPIDRDDIFYVTSDKIFSATVTREQGPWQLKVGYSYVNVSSEADPLEFRLGLFTALDGVAAMDIPTISADARNLRRQMTWKDSRMNIYTIGMVYDQKDWMVQAELGKVVSSIDMSMNGTMAYAVVARRLGDWTPFVLVSGIRPGVGVHSASIPWGEGLPEGVQGPLNALQAGANQALNSTRMNQETFGLGLRWDANSRVALKWQWDATHVRANSYLLRQSLDVSQDVHVNQLSVNLDFTF